MMWRLNLLYYMTHAALYGAEPPPAGGDVLLLEDGDAILLEDGDNILLE